MASRSKPANRASGTLLHLSSLPGPGPIGCMGKQARGFVRFLRDSGQRVWQLLPLTPPARGNSPYSSTSVFAGNPWLIDLTALEAEGLLPSGSHLSLPAAHSRVDFAACRGIEALLRQSFAGASARWAAEIEAFRAENAYWLEDFALYMALRGRFGTGNYLAWPEALRLREPAALDRARNELGAETAFWAYTQYLFHSQWAALRAYAGAQGVRILGDMPIYADAGSADVWAHPNDFLLDQDRAPAMVGGVPPDDFSETGQYWGNPLYHWDRMRENGYAWWIERFRVAGRMYDAVRIDHFRALDEYYEIPAGAPDARQGRWMPGPGLRFLDAVRAAVPGLSLVAEDLGYPTDGVKRLLRDSRIPGLCVLQFAFDPAEQSGYLPHAMLHHCVAYIGTHDNDTAAGWLQNAPPEQTAYAREYLGLNEAEGEVWGFVRALYASVADTVIVQMQDYLGLGSEARMNTPGTPDGNWSWRMASDALSPALCGRIRRLSDLYGRSPRPPK